MFTRSHVRLRTGTTSSNFHRDWKTCSSMATIRVQIQSRNDTLEMSKIKTTFVFTRSHVRRGTIGTTGNFYRDCKLYGSMATIRVQIPSKEDILESTSRTPSKSIAPRFAQALEGYRTISIRIGKQRVA